MQAVILAAGMGKRLKEYTKDNTKCMVCVNGVPLIDRMLRQIEALDLSRIIIVIGYEGQKLVDHVDGLSISTPVVYVSNPVYDKTNNIYSLSLAEKYLAEDDTLLFESDLIFEDSVLKALISDTRPTLALVDKYESWMDGTCVILSDDDTITKFVPGNRFKYSDADRYYKTVNIYKFSKDFSQRVYIPFLKAYMSALGENEYYEQVLRMLTLLDDPQIYAKRLNGEKWYEIDDVQDLDIAQSMFLNTSKEYSQKLMSRYGGYWRYPHIIDLCYPQNNFFPPERCTDEIKAMNLRLIKNYPSGQSIIRLLASKDTLIEENNVLITNGIEESIHVLLNTIPGNIGVIAPTNEYVLDVLEDRAVIFRPEGETCYSVPDILDFFEGVPIEALLLSNPNYHTGFPIADNDVNSLIVWAKTKNIYVIIDETYIDFCCTCNSMMNKVNVGQHNNLIVLKNLSVSYGVPGLRIGCVVSQDSELLNKCQHMIPCWNIDSFSEFFLQIIGKYQSDFSASLDACIRERSFLENELSRIDGISVIKSEACFVLFEICNGMSAEHIVSSMLDQHNILLKDASRRISNSGHQYIKVAVSSHDDNLKLICSLKTVLSTPSRVSESSMDIEETLDFFEQRTLKELPHRYNYVIYQDSNPDLAIERDAYEKRKISPFLSVKPDSLILDIGCGVARWGDYFSGILSDGRYVGIDFSTSLLDIAKKQFEYDDRYSFVQGSFQQMKDVLLKESLPETYDIVLINGVLMYINDNDINGCMNSVKTALNSSGIVYIKESVGVDTRFTLNHFYSSEMGLDYSAIYRSINQYDEILTSVFPSSGFLTLSKGHTWDQSLSNRHETSSYYWILQKL